MIASKITDGARRIPPLVWLMVLRLTIVTAFMGFTFLAEGIRELKSPTDPIYFLMAITYLLTLMYSLAWRFTVSFRKQLAYVQILFDLLTITGIVYYTGGSNSDFSSLYFISIIAASIILFRRGGVVAATLASGLYGSLVQALSFGWLSHYPSGSIESLVTSPSPLVSYTLIVNVFGFYTVALLTSYLSENLRLAGRKLEEATDFLANLQVFNQTILDSITAGLMTTDFNGHINFFNNAAATIFARDKVETLGMNVTQLLSEKTGFLGRLKKGLSKDKRFLRLEGLYLDKRGKEIYLGMSVSYLIYEGEKRSGFLFAFQDLTEIKRLEREVRLKENLATMGEMAAGMAHEIRNPLASISGSVQVLKESEALSDEQKRLMEIIVRESERLSGTLSDFLAYARPSRFEPEQIDLRQVLEETATLLAHGPEVLPEHRILLDIPEHSVILFADPNQMKQITWNLSRNALQAMPSGGQLVMSLRYDDMGAIVMAFRDEGIGMTEGERKTVFAPFAGDFPAGSGLGLAIVYRIVEDYNGVIQVDGQTPKGTVVSIHFPAERR